MQYQGVVFANIADLYYVLRNNGQLYACKLRGKLKTRILSGDLVDFMILDDTWGIIEKLLPRSSELYRPHIANVSLALLLQACSEPEPDLHLLDRLLLNAAHARIKPAILINKSDLPHAAQIEVIRSYYSHMGIPVFLLSALTGEGISEVYRLVQGEIAVLVAPSGVGKTSIIKALTANDSLPTNTLSKKLKRGRHTTRHVEFYQVGSGIVADSPGFSAVDIPAMDKHELRNLFFEFNSLQMRCKFNDCLHVNEPECRVIAAVKSNDILNSRYESYLRMLEEIIARERW